MRDWVEWHQAYADPASGLSARLRSVRRHLSRAIDQAAAGPVRLVSLCAGQGDDVVGVLAVHPRRDQVSAVLVEAEPRNVQVARCRAAAAGLAQVQVRQADASWPESFADALPAGILLLCGIFGNVSDADIERTAAAAPALCAPGATVIWTRHRRSPDLTPSPTPGSGNWPSTPWTPLRWRLSESAGSAMPHPWACPPGPCSPSARHEAGQHAALGGRTGHLSRVADSMVLTRRV